MVGPHNAGRSLLATIRMSRFSVFIAVRWSLEATIRQRTSGYNRKRSRCHSETLDGLQDS